MENRNSKEIVFSPDEFDQVTKIDDSRDVMSQKGIQRSENTDDPSKYSKTSDDAEFRSVRSRLRSWNGKKAKEKISSGLQYQSVRSSPGRTFQANKQETTQIDPVDLTSSGQMSNLKPLQIDATVKIPSTPRPSQIKRKKLGSFLAEPCRGQASPAPTSSLKNVPFSPKPLASFNQSYRQQPNSDEYNSRCIDSNRVEISEKSFVDGINNSITETDAEKKVTDISLEFASVKERIKSLGGNIYKCGENSGCNKDDSNTTGPMNHNNTLDLGINKSNSVYERADLQTMRGKAQDGSQQSSKTETDSKMLSSNKSSTYYHSTHKKAFHSKINKTNSMNWKVDSVSDKSISETVLEQQPSKPENILTTQQDQNKGPALLQSKNGVISSNKGVMGIKSLFEKGTIKPPSFSEKNGAKNWKELKQNESTFEQQIGLRCPTDEEDQDEAFHGNSNRIKPSEKGWPLRDAKNILPSIKNNGDGSIGMVRSKFVSPTLSNPKQIESDEVLESDVNQKISTEKGWPMRDVKNIQSSIKNKGDVSIGTKFVSPTISNSKKTEPEKYLESEVTQKKAKELCCYSKAESCKETNADKREKDEIVDGITAPVQEERDGFISIRSKFESFAQKPCNPTINKHQSKIKDNVFTGDNMTISKYPSSSNTLANPTTPSRTNFDGKINNFSSKATTPNKIMDCDERTDEKFSLEFATPNKIDTDKSTNDNSFTKSTTPNKKDFDQNTNDNTLTLPTTPDEMNFDQNTNDNTLTQPATPDEMNFDQNTDAFRSIEMIHNRSMQTDVQIEKQRISFSYSGHGEPQQNGPSPRSDVRANRNIQTSPNDFPFRSSNDNSTRLVSMNNKVHIDMKDEVFEVAHDSFNDDEDCDGVTLSPTTSDVSDLSIPTCLQSVEESTEFESSTSSSDEDTGAMESGTDKHSSAIGASEASSSHTSEAATPLIHSTLRAMNMTMGRLTNLSDSTHSIDVKQVSGLLGTIPPLKEDNSVEEGLLLQDSQNPSQSKVPSNICSNNNKPDCKKESNFLPHWEADFSAENLDDSPQPSEWEAFVGYDKEQFAKSHESESKDKATDDVSETAGSLKQTPSIVSSTSSRVHRLKKGLRRNRVPEEEKDSNLDTKAAFTSKKFAHYQLKRKSEKLTTSHSNIGRISTNTLSSRKESAVLKRSSSQSLELATSSDRENNAPTVTKKQIFKSTTNLKRGPTNRRFDIQKVKAHQLARRKSFDKLKNSNAK